MPASRPVGGEGVGSPADVGSRQDLAVEVGGWQLLKRQLQDLEVIAGGVGARVARSQDTGQRPARRSRPGSKAAGRITKPLL